jgi:hypothetical protein
MRSIACVGHSHRAGLQASGRGKRLALTQARIVAVLTPNVAATCWTSRQALAVARAAVFLAVVVAVIASPPLVVNSLPPGSRCGR